MAPYQEDQVGPDNLHHGHLAFFCRSGGNNHRINLSVWLQDFPRKSILDFCGLWTGKKVAEKPDSYSIQTKFFLWINGSNSTLGPLRDIPFGQSFDKWDDQYRPRVTNNSFIFHIVLFENKLKLNFLGWPFEFAWFFFCVMSNLRGHKFIQII